MGEVVGESSHHDVEVLLLSVQIFEGKLLGQALVVELRGRMRTKVREKAWEKLW